MQEPVPGSFIGQMMETRRMESMGILVTTRRKCQLDFVE